MNVRACLAFAWANLVRGDRLRLAIAMAGATVSIFILLLHLAFLRAVEDKATQVYALFDAELVMVSERFQFLYRMGDFPVSRLRHALSVPGVADVAAVRVATSRWVTRETGAESTLLVIGLEPEAGFVSDSKLRAELPALRISRNVLIDRRADPEVGPVRVGDAGTIGRQPATVAGIYDLGLPMYAALTAIVANTDFTLFTGRDPQRIQLGLLKLAQGADPRAVVAALKGVIPDDVHVMTRAELMAREAGYFVEVKPLGIMMKAGLVIGLIVGAVALFQVMSSQIESRMRDFAVLRAMGFHAVFTYAVGAWQLAFMGAVAFAAAWLAAIPVFDAISRKSHLSLPLDTWLWTAAVLACVPMIASAALPLLRASRADPAGLFGRA